MRKLYILITTLSLVLFFQNCSEMTFSKSPTGGSEKAVDDQLEVPQPGDENISNETPPDDTDTDTDTDDPSDPGDTPGDTPMTPTPTPVPPGGPKGPKTPEDPGDTPTTDAPVDDGSSGTCRSIDIEKVLVNVNHVELQPSGTVISVPADTVIDLMQLESTGFTFGPVTGLTSVATHQVRLVLNDFGNTIIGTGDEQVPLKTPSAQNSGLKLLLPQDIILEPGKSYLLQVAFDPSTKIVRAGKKCILKPVLRVTQIQEAL
jgi:hypothetical protein